MENNVEAVNIMLRNYIRIILFLSSYSPMFFILAIQNPFNSCTMPIILSVLGAGSIAILFFILHQGLRLAPEMIDVAEVEFKGGEAMSYVVTYIIPFMGVDLSTPKNYVSLGIMFIILAILYMNSNLIYTNPLINVLGYRIFRVQDKDGRNIMLLTKKQHLKAKAQMQVIHLDHNVYMEGRQ